MGTHYHSLVIGGGCLGAACAISLKRKLGRNGKVALLEKKVLGAGLSSRHSAIVRSANASPIAARMAKAATQHWKNLKPLWGVSIPYEQPGAIWIAEDKGLDPNGPWKQLERSMQAEGIAFAMVSHQDVRDMTQGSIRIAPDEQYFYEPDVLQLDAPDILHAMQTALRKNGVEVIEHCPVNGFQTSNDSITAIFTHQGQLTADHVVNAAGGWSSDLFASMGRVIPVALEPVYVANFLVSAREIPNNLPIVADFVNLAYFRRWRGSILHMHQPRRRDDSAVAASFSRSSLNPEGANVIYDALSFNVSHQQLASYLTKVESRFPAIGKPVYAGGYQSFFDITPDLAFILGPDHKIANLYHCLGAGQALKYAPIFGELIAEQIVDRRIHDDRLAIDEFAIARFAGQALQDYFPNRQASSRCL